MKAFFSSSHKTIGLYYFWTTVLIAIFGSYLTYLFRMQIAYPASGFLAFNSYNTTVMFHGLIMVIWVGIPLFFGVLGNLVYPKLIGAGEKNYPALNWTACILFICSAIIIPITYYVYFTGSVAQFTMYPPLPQGLDSFNENNNHPVPSSPVNWGSILLLGGLLLQFLAFSVQAIHSLILFLKKRNPEVKFKDIPVFVWIFNLGLVYFLLTVIPIATGLIMLITDQLGSSQFFSPRNGGDPVLFQHILWFVGQPAITLFFWLGLGVIAEIIYSYFKETGWGKKAIFFVVYMAVFALSAYLFPLLYQQFKTGFDPRIPYNSNSCIEALRLLFQDIAIFFLYTVFITAAVKNAKDILNYFKQEKNWKLALILISAPMILIIIFAGMNEILTPVLALMALLIWLFNCLLSSLFKTSTLWVIGFIISLLFWFLLHAYTYIEKTPDSGFLHDTQIIISQFHNFIVPVIFAGFAGLYHWHNSIFTFPYQEYLGKFHFILTMTFFHVGNLVSIVSSPVKKIYQYADNYPELSTYQPQRVFITCMVIGLILTQLIWLLNMIVSVKNRKKQEYKE